MVKFIKPWFDQSYKWTQTEDSFLKFFINKYGLNKWKKFSSLFLNKTSGECMNRWLLWVNPLIKKYNWNRFEDKKLILIHIKKPFSLLNIAFLLNRNILQSFFRLKFILKANITIERLKKKLNEYLTRKLVVPKNPSQNTYFEQKMSKQTNSIYEKLRLRFFNLCKKKDLKKKHIFTNKLNLEVYKRFFFYEKEQKIILNKFIFNFKLYLVIVIDCKKKIKCKNFIFKKIKKGDFFILKEFYEYDLIFNNKKFYENKKNTPIFNLFSKISNIELIFSKEAAEKFLLYFFLEINCLYMTKIRKQFKLFCFVLVDMNNKKLSKNFFFYHANTFIIEKLHKLNLIFSKQVLV
jgi:hypothetical protein